MFELSVFCHSKRASISYVFSPVFGVQLSKTIVKKHWKKHCKSWSNNVYKRGHWNPFEIKKNIFFEDFLPDWKKWTLRHDPFTHDQHNSIFKFLGGVTEINYQEIHIFRPKKVMMNRLYCLDRKYCSHFCTGVSLLII